MVKENHLLINLIKNKKKIKLGHRGKTKNNQENTLKACLEGLKDPELDGIEIDIQLTKDNQIIVFHDDCYNRLLDLNSKVKETNYKDIKDLNLNSNTGNNINYQNSNKILRFDDFINKIQDLKITNKIINIELKTNSSYQTNNYEFLIDNTIDICKNIMNQIYFSSFDKNMIKFLNNHDKYQNLLYGPIIDDNNNLQKYIKNNKLNPILILNKNLLNSFQNINNIIIGAYTFNDYNKDNYNDHRLIELPDLSISIHDI